LSSSCCLLRLGSSSSSSSSLSSVCIILSSSAFSLSLSISIATAGAPLAIATKGREEMEVGVSRFKGRDWRSKCGKMCAYVCMYVCMCVCMCVCICKLHFYVCECFSACSYLHFPTSQFLLASSPSFSAHPPELCPFIGRYVSFVSALA
jgi:hypothetical protein